MPSLSDCIKIHFPDKGDAFVANLLKQRANELVGGKRVTKAASKKAVDYVMAEFQDSSTFLEGQIQELVATKTTPSPEPPKAEADVAPRLEGEGVAQPEIVTPPAEKTGPLFTEAQVKRRAKAKETKAKQEAVESAKQTKEQVHSMIRDRRESMNLATYETNLFVNDIEKKTTRRQREAIPFVIEGTEVPKGLKRPDLEKALAKDINKLSPIAQQVKEHFDKGWQKIKENTPDMSTEQIENYVTHLWDIPKAKKQEVTNWFITQNRFLKKRFIETINEGVEKFGLEPKVLDIGEIIRVHDAVANRVIENNKFVERLKELKNEEGVALIARTDKAPDGWITFDHPALRRGMFIPGKDKPGMLTKVSVDVHPDLVKPLKVIFDSKFDHEIIKAYEVLNGVLKKTNLTFSLFHHGALGETGVAIMGVPKVANVYFNPVKIYKAMVKGEFDVYKKEPIARDAISHGLQVGATSDIPVNMIQSKLNNLARKTKDVPLINKTTELIRTFNQQWDKALWEYLHDTLKLHAYESLVSKVDIAKDVKKQKQEIAQLVNDTFGGQNWDTLMVSPKTLQIMNWSLLSPDWTTSTVRQALSPTGIGAIHKETAGLRKQMGKHFWIKAGLYFGVGMNLLNYTFRKWDEEKNPQYYEGQERTFMDRTMVGNTIGKKTNLFVGRYEDGSERYVRWGKQFRELPELFFDDTGFSPVSATLKKVGGKLAPVPQLVSQITTGHTLSGFRNDDVYGKKGWDKTLGIAKTLIKSPLPFSSRTLFQEGKEFHISDIAMPSSKGMTRYKAIELFKYGIVKQDERFIKEVYQFALQNNLPAYTLFGAGITSLKAEATKEYTKGIDTIDKAMEQLREVKTPSELKKLGSKIRRLKKEQQDRLLGMALFDIAIQKMEIYEGTNE